MSAPNDDLEFAVFAAAAEELAGPAAANLAINQDLIALLPNQDIWNLFLGEKGNSLSLSEWVHNATLGRDHYVRIVYEGHLWPFGHRAALIKVTERKIRDVKGADGLNHPIAYLVQHMFIVVRQPLRDYTGGNIPANLAFGWARSALQEYPPDHPGNTRHCRSQRASAHPLRRSGYDLFLLGASWRGRQPGRRF